MREKAFPNDPTGSGLSEFPRKHAEAAMHHTLLLCRGESVVSAGAAHPGSVRGRPAARNIITEDAPAP
jgi:hypothetical protein